MAGSDCGNLATSERFHLSGCRHELMLSASPRRDPSLTLRVSLESSLADASGFTSPRSLADTSGFLGIIPR